MPEVERSDDSVHSLIDVDSPHISSVHSTYSEQSTKTTTQAEREEREQEAEARHAAERAKDKARAKGRRARENADNPVILGNMITVGILGAVLGYGAYRKYSVGELTWKVAGAWAGVVGLFAVGDYYVSQ